MISRNQIIWMIKNGRFPGLLFWFFLMLPYRMLYAFFKNRNQYHSLIQALQKLKPAMQGRRASDIVVKDKIWSQQINQPYP
jgi:hypothetical protein